jgi:hypothetical protein
MRIPILIYLLLTLAPTALPQSPCIPEVRRVTHCIKAGDREWLTEPLANARSLRVAMVHDRTSYPGEDTIVVVVLETDYKGQFFAVQADCKKEQCTYDIQNNGSFTFKKNHFDFVDPPLGGVWTQERLERNIKKALSSRVTWLEVSSVLKPISRVRCTSYAENSRKNAQSQSK